MTISATARTSSRVKGNRLVKAARRVDAETTVATYEYYGDNRRLRYAYLLAGRAGSNFGEFGAAGRGDV